MPIEGFRKLHHKPRGLYTSLCYPLITQLSFLTNGITATPRATFTKKELQSVSNFIHCISQIIIISKQ